MLPFETVSELLSCLYSKMFAKPFKQNRDRVSSSNAGALYVHVPFCLAKCRYCSFYSLPFASQPAERFVRAARIELAGNLSHLARPLKSVFFGGGTPTVLGTRQLVELFDEIAPLIDESTEFSLEANPGTLTPELLDMLRDSPVNRINLGVQSFCDEELKALGRIHTAAQARKAVDDLADKGFSNLGVDLIYGIPGQSLRSWGESLGRALGLEITHLSCYGLSIEPDTPMHDDLVAGKISEMADELQRQCYYAAIEAACDAGMDHYEISNFARPPFHCKHNVTYWNNMPYLGIGPGAASFIQGRRRTNLPDLQAYSDALLAGTPPPCTSEQLVGAAAMAETLMLGLRLRQGVDRGAFKIRFRVDPLDAFPQSLSRHAQVGSLEITPARIRIAKQFLFVADSILADIIAEG